LGVEISIDDFGTGYSSLSYLKKLPINTIKIDRSFIHDLTGHMNNGSTIVAGIAAMAKGLKLNVVAEGVETQEQLDYMSTLGCDAYQGFLFSRPVASGKSHRDPRPPEKHDAWFLQRGTAEFRDNNPPSPTRVQPCPTTDSAPTA
jgi:EAL domain-containing protein (putative c-di-GMP-specific phosphodiesterase class I)